MDLNKLIEKADRIDKFKVELVLTSYENGILTRDGVVRYLKSIIKGN